MSLGIGGAEGQKALLTSAQSSDTGHIRTILKRAGAGDCIADSGDDGFRMPMSATRWFRHDLVNDPGGKQILCGDLARFDGRPYLRGVSPQCLGDDFGRNSEGNSVLEHQHAIRRHKRQGASSTALSDDGRDHRNRRI